MKEVINLCKAAKAAERVLAQASSEKKNRALAALANLLEKNRLEIQKENRKDIAQAAAKKLSAAFMDRLTLSNNAIDEMIGGLRQIIALDNPIGSILEERKLANGLLLRKVSVPLGVIAMIYESRPNVTVDASALCLKSGNAVILRGGSDSFHTNMLLTQIVRKALKEATLPENAAQQLPATDREMVNVLLKQDKYIDVVIPRGGYGLIRAVSENSIIPTLKHFEGICHVYIDKDADIEMAKKICFNAKVSRPAVCNAMECMVVHKDIAKKFLPSMAAQLKAAGVLIKGDAAARAILPDIEPAAEDDWDTEFLDLILAVKVVDSLEEAIDFISEHGSGHSEAIVSSNDAAIKKFMDNVDASAVFANASTRFNDGQQFGMGAEIGISTQKLHARGPVGLKELTSYKYEIFGSGQVRA